MRYIAGSDTRKEPHQHCGRDKLTPFGFLAPCNGSPVQITFVILCKLAMVFRFVCSRYWYCWKTELEYNELSTYASASHSGFHRSHDYLTHLLRIYQLKKSIGGGGTVPLAYESSSPASICRVDVIPSSATLSTCRVDDSPSSQTLVSSSSVEYVDAMLTIATGRTKGIDGSGGLNAGL